MKRSKLRYLLAFAAIISLRADPPKVVVGTEYCCTSTFEFSQVQAFARRLLPRLSGDFYSLMIVPEVKRGNLGFAGTSEVSLSFCLSSAVSIREGFTHAYLLKTPFGAGLHHWDARQKVYRSVVLAGKDIYTETFPFGKIAALGDWYERTVPQVWLVPPANAPAEQSLQFAKDAAGMLKLSNADVYLRSDPYLWRPDKCPTLTVPLQWATAETPDEKTVSHVTVYCRLRSDPQSESCTVYRSP